MNNRLTKAERGHLARIKALPCAVCGQAGPSDAHHVRQHLQYTCIPLCRDCHMGSHNGVHGQSRIWRVLRKDELSCLNDTVRALVEGAHA